MKTFLFFLVFISLAFLLYGNSLQGEFVLDDLSVVQNPTLQQTSGVFKVFISPYYYARPQAGLYRPLVLASFWGSQFFSRQPAISHLTNLLLHGVISFEIFLLILALKKDHRTAWFGALIFMFLPIHIESVASIVGRTELLAFLFLISAWLAVLKNKYLLAGFLFLLALFSKETAIAFLPVWIYLELVHQKKNWRELIKPALFFIFPLVFYTWLRYLALGRLYFLNAGGYAFFNPLREIEFWPRFLTAAKVLFLYGQKIIFPAHFSSDYSYNQIPVVTDLFHSWSTIAGLSILGGLVFLVFRSKNNLIRLGSLIFLSSYFVVSNFIFKIGTIMAERLMYLPSLGFALISAEGLATNFLYKKYRKMLWLIFVFILLIYGRQIILGNRLWRNEKTLFANAYRQAPHSTVNAANLASLLYKNGQLKKALVKVNEALTIDPQNAPALTIKGQVQLGLGLNNQAEESWKTAVAIQPDYLYPYLSLGLYYYQKGDFSAGETILSQAPSTKPPLSNLMTLLALNKIGLGKYKETVDLIESSFGTNPAEDELWFVLGLAYLKNGAEQSARNFLLKFKDSSLTEKQYLQLLKTKKIFPVSI